jgi:hypothetical protein
MATHATHSRWHDNFTFWQECLIALQTMTRISGLTMVDSILLQPPPSAMVRRRNQDLVFWASQAYLDSRSLLMVAQLFCYHIINSIYFGGINLK